MKAGKPRKGAQKSRGAWEGDNFEALPLCVSHSNCLNRQAKQATSHLGFREILCS